MSAVIALSEAVSMDLATKRAVNVNVGAIPTLDICENFPGRHICNE